MKCGTCGEEEFVHGCTPSVAAGDPWLCRNPKTLEQAEQREFADSLADLAKAWRPPNAR